MSIVSISQPIAKPATIEGPNIRSYSQTARENQSLRMSDAILYEIRTHWSLACRHVAPPMFCGVFDQQLRRRSPPAPKFHARLADACCLRHFAIRVQQCLSLQFRRPVHPAPVPARVPPIHFLTLAYLPNHLSQPRASSGSSSSCARVMHAIAHAVMVVVATNNCFLASRCIHCGNGSAPNLR